MTLDVPAPARSPKRWAAAGVAGLALAAGLLLAIQAPPERADPTTLVPRGSGETSPVLGLRVAVRRGEAVERLAAGRSYQSGDTLLFRVSVPAPMEITLRRDEVVLFRGAVPAGDSDLPVGYTLEAGEHPARFVVEGGGASDGVAIPGVAP